MSDSTLPTILHIEDNPDIAMIVSKVLSQQANIVNVDNLSQAREVLQQQTFDLAILDLVLPDGSGLDLVNELRSQQPPIPVIIHSAHEISDNIYNVEAVLSKMYTPHDVLRDTVDQLLHPASAASASG